jgi:hypothetical protein
VYPRTLLIFAFTIALVPPLVSDAQAQDSVPPETHGAPGDRESQRMPGGERPEGGRGGRRMTRPDPVVFNGPPAPAEFARIVKLPAENVTRYTQLYDRFMETTRPQRDSLAAMRRDRREAYNQGDRETARRHRGQLRPLAEDLARQQVTFDDTLKPILTKAQWKRYEQWREDQRKQAAKAWKDQRRPA